MGAHGSQKNGPWTGKRQQRKKREIRRSQERPHFPWTAGLPKFLVNDRKRGPAGTEVSAENTLDHFRGGDQGVIFLPKSPQKKRE